MIRKNKEKKHPQSSQTIFEQIKEVEAVDEENPKDEEWSKRSK